MTCAQARREMYASDRRGGAFAEPLRAHVEICEYCAADWSRMERLDAALGALREATAQETPAADSERRVLEAFRIARAGSTQAAQASRPVSGWTARPWMASAAAVIAAFAVGSAVAVYRHGGTAPDPSGTPASPARALAVPRAGSDAVQALEGLAAAAPVEGDGEVALETASDFVVLPYGPPTLEGPLHLVQVALPRQRLLDLSVDDPMELVSTIDDEDIVAVDVLVDEFGTARAVRLPEPADGEPHADSGSRAFD